MRIKLLSLLLAISLVCPLTVYSDESYSERGRRPASSGVFPKSFKPAGSSVVIDQKQAVPAGTPASPAGSDPAKTPVTKPAGGTGTANPDDLIRNNTGSDGKLNYAGISDALINSNDNALIAQTLTLIAQNFGINAVYNLIIQLAKNGQKSDFFAAVQTRFGANDNIYKALGNMVKALDIVKASPYNMAELARQIDISNDPVLGVFIIETSGYFHMTGFMDNRDCLAGIKEFYATQETNTSVNTTNIVMASAYADIRITFLDMVRNNTHGSKLDIAGFLTAYANWAGQDLTASIVGQDGRTSQNAGWLLQNMITNLFASELSKAGPQEVAAIIGAIGQLGHTSPGMDIALFAGIVVNSGKITPEAAISLLKNTDVNISRGAAMILTYMGDTAVPALITALSGRSALIARQAADILVAIESPAALSALRNLQSADPNVRNLRDTAIASIENKQRLEQSIESTYGITINDSPLYRFTIEQLRLIETALKVMPSAMLDKITSINNAFNSGFHASANPSGGSIQINSYLYTDQDFIRVIVGEAAHLLGTTSVFDALWARSDKSTNMDFWREYSRKNNLEDVGEAILAYCLDTKAEFIRGISQAQSGHPIYLEKMLAVMGLLAGPNATGAFIYSSSLGAGTYDRTSMAITTDSQNRVTSIRGIAIYYNSDGSLNTARTNLAALAVIFSTKPPLILK